MRIVRMTSCACITHVAAGSSPCKQLSHWAWATVWGWILRTGYAVSTGLVVTPTLQHRRGPIKPWVRYIAIVQVIYSCMHASIACTCMLVHCMHAHACTCTCSAGMLYMSCMQLSIYNTGIQFASRSCMLHACASCYTISPSMICMHGMAVFNRMMSSCTCILI